MKDVNIYGPPYTIFVFNHHFSLSFLSTLATCYIFTGFNALTNFKITTCSDLICCICLYAKCCCHISFAALYLTAVSVLAGFWGQYFVRKLMVILKRASIIVFILSGVIFASALTMGKVNHIQSQLLNLYSFRIKVLL